MSKHAMNHDQSCGSKCVLSRTYLCTPSLEMPRLRAVDSGLYECGGPHKIVAFLGFSVCGLCGVCVCAVRWLR